MSAFLTILYTATTKDYKGNTLFFLVVHYTHPIGLERTVYLALAREEGCQLSERSLTLLMPHFCQYAAKKKICNHRSFEGKLQETMMRLITRSTMHLYSNNKITHLKCRYSRLKNKSTP